MHVYPSFETLNGYDQPQPAETVAQYDYFNYNMAIQNAQRSALFQHWMATGYYAGSGNDSFESKLDWFESPYSFELLPITRPNDDDDDRSSQQYLEEMATSLDWKIEKNIIWRAQPSLKKEITIQTNLVAGLFFSVFFF